MNGKTLKQIRSYDLKQDSLNPHIISFGFKIVIASSDSAMIFDIRR